MILTDREIKIYIERKLIIVDPVPSIEAYTSTALDLTLDPTISLFKKEKPGIDRSIDPSNPEFKSNDVVDEQVKRNIIAFCSNQTGTQQHQ